jgi:hypothetical protein
MVWVVGMRVQDLYVLFSLNVAILGFAYLFLDRYNHLMNQAKEQNVVHPNAQYPLGRQAKPDNLHESGVQVQSTNSTNNV